jgi:hypothetical protein
MLEYHFADQHGGLIKILKSDRSIPIGRGSVIILDGIKYSVSEVIYEIHYDQYDTYVASTPYVVLTKIDQSYAQLPFLG